MLAYLLRDRFSVMRPLGGTHIHDARGASRAGSPLLRKLLAQYGCTMPMLLVVRVVRRWSHHYESERGFLRTDGYGSRNFGEEFESHDASTFVRKIQFEHVAHFSGNDLEEGADFFVRQFPGLHLLGERIKVLFDDDHMPR